MNLTHVSLDRSFFMKFDQNIWLPTNCEKYFFQKIGETKKNKTKQKSVTFP